MDKMTIEKAREFVENYDEYKDSNFRLQTAKGFIEGWDARMEYEAEINGKPKEPGE
jgi:hypothetical protein